MDNKKIIDVVLDTDAYNEIDDQFAISYLLMSKEKLNTKAIYAAPFLNSKSVSPKDGMEKSYDEILKLLSLIGTKKEVYKGSENYLKDEKTPVVSDASLHLSKLAGEYSPTNPLYVVSIGAITNVASAILLNPQNAKNMVIVWLGGHSYDYCDTKEFNMYQDIAAARVVFSSSAYVVQLPCNGVVSEFCTTKYELEYWLKGKNKICDYLCENTIHEAESYALGKPWSRVIWDVTAVGYLLNENDRFMLTRKQKTRLPEYDFYYSQKTLDKEMEYVYHINRDQLFEDMVKKLSLNKE